MKETDLPSADASRIPSIDQYRGYAVFGMILVNYLGGFDSMPWHFKHHDNAMSYADTIAPLFMFVAGMGLRLSLLRRLAHGTPGEVYPAILRRFTALILVGIVVYGPALDNWRYWWDALVDIGFAGILALPVLCLGKTARALTAFAYLLLFQVLYMITGYGEWTMARSIDGGPLGPLSWAFIFILGTIAYDAIATKDRRRIVWTCLGWGVALCALGWLLRAEWPGLKEAWPFTQRGMTMPYALYSTGLCFLMYLPFYFICDVRGWKLPHLTALGMNPLVIYIVQQALGDMHGSFLVPDDSTPYMAVLGFTAFYLACYAVAWRLEKDRVVIKL
jgi:predicted acyltransferase